MFLYNDNVLMDRRRRLRKEPTSSETILWERVRKDRFQGIRFFRQYSIGPYILDFYCPKKRLAIEIDGLYHAQTDQRSYDEERTTFLKEQDIRVLRFWNHEIHFDLDRVLAAIKRNLPLS